MKSGSITGILVVFFLCALAPLAHSEDTLAKGASCIIRVPVAAGHRQG